MASTVSFFVVIPAGFQFLPIAPGQPVAFCQPYLVQTTDDSKVQLSGGTQSTFTFAGKSYTGVLCDDTAQIQVLNGAQRDFKFSVCTASGSVAGYFLTGVMLKNTDNGTSAGSAFPVVTIDITGTQNGSLTLEDRPGKDTLNYELWLMMQDGNGNLGLIDPRIVNQN